MNFHLLCQSRQVLFANAKVTCLLLFGIFWATTSFAQRTISGVITDAENGEPLIGVTIQVKGQSTGTITDYLGNYELEVADDAAALVFSFVGYQSVEEPINGRTAIDMALGTSAVGLDAVTITALGIKRETKALGYAVQELDGSEVQQVKDPNLVNNLAGKVAGVQINNGGSGVGSSSRIVIRGESSLSGNNQPLFVVNGIPVNNDIGGNGRAEGNLETDYGNGAAEINPDDIETISVLKGANATALYGSRAANGVILITTKTGAGKKGLGVSFNSSTTIDRPLRIPEYQNDYGQGSNFQFEFVNGSGAGTADGVDESWGPSLDGQLIVQHNSPTTSGVRAGDTSVRPQNADGTFADNPEALPWTPSPDNIEDFFETGVTTQNNIAIFGGNNTSNFRLSYTNLYSEGILPNTDLKRNTLNFDLGHQLLDGRLRFNLNANYINSSSDNRPNNSYGTENIMYLWVWFGRHIDMNTLRDYWQPGLTNIQQFNYNYNWHDNPYFTMFENTNAFDKNRVFGNVSATFDITPQLSFMLRTGVDYFDELRVGRRAFSTQRFPQGQYREDNVFFQERNTDFLFTYSPLSQGAVTLTVNAGGNQMTQDRRFKRTAANQLAIPGIYSFNNSAIPLTNNQFNSQRRINSLYASASIGIKNAVFIDLAGRNDWSSTLPTDNNSYFYPSASLSLVVDEIVELPEVISFAKVRAGWGQVGNDTDPYNLVNYFQFLGEPYGTQLLGTENNVLANSNLLPEQASTLELGADLRFMKGRLGLDFTYFFNNTENQILEVPVSQTSGYGSRFINAGEIESNGIEILFNATPVKVKDFTWNVGINFSRIRSEVVKLTEGIDVYQISGNYLQVLAIEGGRMGDVYGTGFKLIDTDTNEEVIVDDIEDIQDSYAHLYDANGFPVRDPNLRKLGNYNPDWIAGISNEFSWKGLTLGVLFDWRQGGVVMSRTLLIGGTSGMMAETAQFNRETTEFIGGVTQVDGVEVLDRPGVQLLPDGTYAPNGTSLSARDFYWSHFNRGNEEVGMYDASFVKLRELRLSYSLPQTVVSKIGAEAVRISFIGRNLALWTENPHFDPEVFSFDGNTIVPGVEDMATPSTRSFGVNLNITF